MSAVVGHWIQEKRGCTRGKEKKSKERKLYFIHQRTLNWDSFKLRDTARERKKKKEKGKAKK